MRHPLKSKIFFCVERITVIVARNLASTMRALSSAQQPIVDEINSDYSENDDSLNVGGDRYQIVNSCLPANGDYQIAKRMYTYQYLH